MTISKKIFKLLDKLKYFGARKVYYVLKGPIQKGSFKLSLKFLALADTLYPRLVRRNLTKKIIVHFDGDRGHNLGKNPCFLGFGLIHYSLIRNLKPKRILCIGSRQGFIPAILALACKDNKQGKVDFVDASYSKGTNKSWGGTGFWKKTNPEHHFSTLNLSRHIKTHVITSEEFSKKYPKRKYQYIYIDGDHSYQGVKLDYELFWPKLEKNGFMVFHDVIAKGKLEGGTFGVWKLWKEINSKGKIILPFPKTSGLGIVQKK
jgi:hypothetical protein